MAQNIEIKAVARDVERQRALAEKLCGGLTDTLRQRDTFFEVAVGRLKLREFAAGNGELIHYQRPDQSDAKLSDYRISETSCAKTLRTVLSRALTPAGEVSKTRQLYLLGQTRIHFDQVQQLGDFIELEVVMRSDQPVDEGRSIVADIMRQLEISTADLINGAYIDLLNALDAITAVSGYRAGRGLDAEVVPLIEKVRFARCEIEKSCPN